MLKQSDAWKVSLKITLWFANIFEKYNVPFYVMFSLQETVWFEKQRRVAYFEHTHMHTRTHLTGPPAQPL